MQQQAIVPSVITCNALISACEQSTLIKQAFEVLWALRRRGALSAAATAYSVLTSARETGMQPEGALLDSAQYSKVAGEAHVEKRRGDSVQHWYMQAE